MKKRLKIIDNGKNIVVKSKGFKKNENVLDTIFNAYVIKSLYNGVTICKIEKDFNRLLYKNIKGE